MVSEKFNSGKLLVIIVVVALIVVAAFVLLNPNSAIGQALGIKSRLMQINKPPVADFTFSPSSPVVDQTVAFDPTCGNLSNPCSYDFDGIIVAYKWSFGDGSETLEKSPKKVTHSYNTAGEYNVILSVKDNAGSITRVEKTVKVGVPNKPPVADFTFSPSSPVVGESVSFDASLSSDSDGSIVFYNWDFGDGSSDSDINASHSFSATGDYTVTLTVTDDGGLTDTSSQVITVSSTTNNPPVAKGTVFIRGNGATAESATLDITPFGSYDPDGDAIRTFIKVDNSGYYFIEPYAMLSYPVNVGTHTVTIKAVDSKNAEDYYTETVTVPSYDSNDEPPTGTLSCDNLTPVVGQPVTCTVTASDPDGYIKEYAWLWGFSASDVGLQGLHFSTSTQDSYAFNAFGDAFVQVYFTDDKGFTWIGPWKKITVHTK